MGGSAWSKSDWDNYSSSNIRGRSTTQVYRSTSTKSEYDPKKIKVRESCDSTGQPNSTPIIIGLDVTGSMNSILDTTANKLGIMVESILTRKPVEDPHIMFNAIGDAMCDSSPFQATQFESDIKIAKQLTDLYFEKGGGGNGFESYPLAWYFASRHTKIDSFEKRKKKGFLFTIGDDGYPAKITKREIEEVFGDTIEADIPVGELLNEVNRKYEVFHLYLADRAYDSDRQIEKWRGLMGERAIKVIDYNKIPEIIVSILEAMAGKSVEEIANSWDGSTALVVKEALNGLTSTSKDTALVDFE